MDSITIILVLIIFFLAIALIYSWLTKSKAKNQENKEFLSTAKENNETKTNSALELKAKVEEIYQKLIIGEEVNKTLLGNDRVPLWLLKTHSLKIVDFLVWHKKNTLELGVGKVVIKYHEFRPSH